MALKQGNYWRIRNNTKLTMLHKKMWGWFWIGYSLIKVGVDLKVNAQILVKTQFIKDWQKQMCKVVLNLWHVLKILWLSYDDHHEWWLHCKGALGV